ncbi:NaeI family type II restriction endonuclease [Streptomyces sp. AGS-58]|uniref:NaeI family type II restriction endonuclease n=1 Tax=unclassified Streptomyces TaxID=2593676 RepID=UPI0035A3505C
MHELLKNSGYPEKQLPARSTFHRKMRGIGLKSERRLVEEVIGVCVPDERKANVHREQAVSLLQQAWSMDAKPTESQRAPAQGNGELMPELIRVQRELIDVRAQLAVALQTATDAERDAARSRTLLTTLLMLGTFSGGPHALPARSTDIKADRTETPRAATAARSHPAKADLPLDASTTNSASSTGSQDRAIVGSRLEWPTTHTDPVDRSALPYAPRASDEDASNPDVLPSERKPRQDTALEEVLVEMMRLDPDGSRVGSAIDSAGQHLLDPVHTGRYLWSHLQRTERIVFGTTVHQRVQRELGLHIGSTMDFTVAGHEVDLRFTLGRHEWMFPPEVQGHLCLVMSADDVRGRWSLGLLRVEPNLVRSGANRDGKRGLNAEGRRAINWIHYDLPLPDHALRHLSRDTLVAIHSQPLGQARVEELLLQAQLTPISQADLSAVTRSTDGPRRVREARLRLARQGVLVLNGSIRQHVDWASALSLPVPAPKRLMSVRLTPASPQRDDDMPTVTLDGAQWRVARPDDPEAPLPREILR